MTDSVYSPQPEKNVVVTALKNKDLYKIAKGQGKHEIICPWIEQHTDGADGGTAYFEPDETYPLGGFHCFHEHCANRHIQDLLGWLDISPNIARMKPIIRAIGGELNRVVEVAEKELSMDGSYYQRGGSIVEVINDPGTNLTRIHEINQPSLMRALSRIATWMHYDKRNQQWVRCDPHGRYIAVLHDVAQYPHIPVLNGLARQPYLRSDGSLVSNPGYDGQTCLYGIFNRDEFIAVKKPDKNHALKALERLAELVKEFSFATYADRSAAICAILTAVVRASLDLAPMFHVKAHMVGSGKSYLCKLITAFASPQRGNPTTFPKDDEECRKLLLAELMYGPAVIEFDNLTSYLLAHKSLCTALTSEYFSGRVLGVSKTATVSTRTLFLSSGNNVGPIQDMARRCITIHLEPQCEIPATRIFKRPHLIKEVLAERASYVCDALNIIRAWIEAGRPHIACKGPSGFEPWSDLCRQPLLWLGCDDPALSVFTGMAEDPERETLERLLTAWQKLFGGRPTLIREAVEASYCTDEENKELAEVIHDIAEDRGEINRRRLGKWILRNSGKIVDGFRFSKGSGNHSAVQWKVESVSSVSGNSSGNNGNRGA